jgi:Entner-Doudoroff aldolase
MTIEEVIRRIGEIGIVPVVRAATVEDATSAVEAICAGGIPIVEITMTVPNATSVIRHVVREHGSTALIGAGTVTTAEQAEQCIRAGAEFLVSPGLSVRVLAVAQSCAKLAIPGALTPTELMHAQDNGARLIKIFPCGNLGGPKYLQSLKGPQRCPDSNRRRERFKRRRLHCGRGVCSRSGRGSCECGCSARWESGEDHASGPRAGADSSCGARTAARLLTRSAIAPDYCQA